MKKLINSLIAFLLIFTSIGFSFNSVAALEKTHEDTDVIYINDSEKGSGLNEFNFHGSWKTSSGHPDKFYGGDEHWFNFANYTEGEIIPNYSIKFMGTGIEIFGNTGPSMGIYDIYIDGIKVDDVDAYSSSLVNQVSLYRINDLELGEHEIKVQLTTRKNGLSTSSDGEVDYVKVFNFVEPEPVERGPILITPTPQETLYFDTAGASITDKVNIVIFESMDTVVDTYTLNKIKHTLETNGFTYEITSVLSETLTNLVLIDQSVLTEEEVMEYVSDQNINFNLGEEKQAYTLKIRENAVTNITIISSDSSGLYFGVTTLSEVLAQPNDDGLVYEVEINDFPNLEYRGFIEGFFGPPWTHEGRKELLNFSSDVKMNRYIYGPKDDEYHRTKWRQPYPEELGKQISELAELSKVNNVEFTWAVHTTLGGDTIDFESQKDRDDLIAKFENMYVLGVRSYSIFYDDVVNNSLKDPIKQADLSNYILENFIKKYDDIKPFSVVPTEYAGVNKTYLEPFGENLHEDIVVLWTGTSVVPDSISKADIDRFNEALGREALVWWNYPVNDYWYDTPGRLFLGPVTGLDKAIDNTYGILSNPMSWESASQIALYGLADFTWNPKDYDSNFSWEKSIEKLVPDYSEEMKLFAKNSSHLGTTANMVMRRSDSPYLNDLFLEFNETLAAKESIVDVASRLQIEFEKMIDAAAKLKTMDNTDLLGEIDLWLNQFSDVGITGAETMKLYIAIEEGNTDIIGESSSKVEEAFGRMAKNTRVTQIGAMPVLPVILATQYVTPFIEKAFTDFKVTEVLSEVNIEDFTITTNAPIYQSYVKELAIDGDLTSKLWTSKGQEVGQEFRITFDKEEELHNMVVLMEGTDYIRHGQLQYSLDGEVWTDFAEMKDFSALGKYKAVIGYAEGVLAKYARIIVTKADSSWTNINEIVFTKQGERTVIEGNLALNKDVTFSSVAGGLTDDVYNNPQWVGSKAVDGLQHTKWVSETKAEEYLEVDLGSLVPISEVVLSFGSVSERFKVEVSTDGTTYQTILDGEETDDTSKSISIPVDLVPARYVRYTQLAPTEETYSLSEYGTSITEFEVYRDSVRELVAHISEFKTTIEGLSSGSENGNVKETFVVEANAVIAKYQALIDIGTVTVDDVDKAVVEFAKLLSELEDNIVMNKVNAQLLIDQLAVNVRDYTKESFTDHAGYIEDVQKRLDVAKNAREVTVIEVELESHVSKLVAVDRNLISEIIEKLHEENLKKYTDTSKLAAKVVYKQAVRLDAVNSISKSEYDSLVETFNLLKLELLGDVKTLDDAILEAGRIDRSKYTKESLAVFDEKLGNAIDVASRANDVTQEEIDFATKELLDSIKALVEIENPSETETEVSTTPVDKDVPTGVEMNAWINWSILSISLLGVILVRFYRRKNI